MRFQERIEAGGAPVCSGLPSSMDIHILEGSLYVTDVLIGGFFGRVWITINDSVHQMVVLVPQVLEVIGAAGTGSRGCSEYSGVAARKDCA